MKKALSFLVVACMAFGLVACGNKGDEAKIFIGGLAPLSGGASQYGIASNNGTQLAVDEINANGGILGKQIFYKYYDEKGDPTEAINAYNRLVQEGMVALIGDITTKPTIAVAEQAQQGKIPMITPTGTGAAITEIGDHIFRACYTDPYQGELLASYAVEKLGAKTAAILYDTTDDYSKGVADAFEAKAKVLGVEITTKEGYEKGTSDFNTQLAKIAQGNPDVIMAPCYYEDASKIIVQARNMGVEAKMLGPDGWDGILDKMNESNYASLNNSFYCSQYAMGEPSENLQKFINGYAEKYGETDTINMFAVLGYEAMYLMAAAIENAGSTDAAAIVAALQTLEYEGVSGKISFLDGQDPVREAIIIEFVDGEEAVLGVYAAE